MIQTTPSIAFVLMKAFERSFVEAYVSLRHQNKNKLTTEVEEDYRVFRLVAKEIFEKTGQFSTDLMLKKIPCNKFTPLYIQHCAKKIKGRNEVNMTETEITSKLFSKNDVIIH